MAQPLTNQSTALAGEVDNVPEEFHISETNRSDSNLEGRLDRRGRLPLCYLTTPHMNESLPMTIMLCQQYRFLLLM